MRTLTQIVVRPLRVKLHQSCEPFSEIGARFSPSFAAVCIQLLVATREVPIQNTKSILKIVR